MSGYSSVAAAKLVHRKEDGRVRLRHAFPLLFVGVASVLVGAALLLNGVQIHSVRVPIWLLALAIGAVALGGGMTAALAGDFDAPVSPSPARRPTRQDWEEDTGPAPRGSPPSALAFRGGAELPAPTPGGLLVLEAPTLSAAAAPPAPRKAPAPPPAPPRSLPVPAVPAGATLTPPNERALEAALSDLEKIFHEMRAQRATSAEARKASPSGAEPTAPRKPARSPPPPRKEAAPAVATPSAQVAGELETLPAGVPSEVVDEFSRLLSEFYPDIRPGSSDGRSRLASPRRVPLGCPGCGRSLVASGGQSHCMRCTRTMCDDCAQEAASAKRALLCESCFATYGIGSPGG
jgi:hypothetical protein